MPEVATSIVTIRERNRAETQRKDAIALVSEHLEYYGAIAKHASFTTEDRQKFATRMVDAVISLTRPS